LLSELEVKGHFAMIFRFGWQINHSIILK